MSGYTRPRLMRNLQRLDAKRVERQHKLLRQRPGGVWLRIHGRELPVLLPSRTANREANTGEARWRPALTEG